MNKYNNNNNNNNNNKRKRKRYKKYKNIIIFFSRLISSKFIFHSLTWDALIPHSHYSFRQLLL